MTIKDAAIELRRQGKTYGEISRALSVPKGTLSGWFKNEPWSKEITRQWTEKSGRKQIGILNAQRAISIDKRHEQAEKEARADFQLHSTDPLFVSGLSLYWGEGDKRTRYQVRITNTDSGIILIFLRFLTTYTDIERSRIWVSLIIYDDLDVDDCEKFWQEKTGLGAEHFQKTVTIRSRSIERKSPYGICVLGISSSVLKTKMLVWIAELAKTL